MTDLVRTHTNPLVTIGVSIMDSNSYTRSMIGGDLKAVEKKVDMTMMVTREATKAMETRNYEGVHRSPEARTVSNV